jgi:hypothetical protein
VNLPIVQISDQLFSGCFNLSQLSCPGTSIAPYELSISQNILSIRSYAFNNTQFRTIRFQLNGSFPTLTTSSYAFSSIPSLIQVIDFPCLEISPYLFSSCPQLKQMNCSGVSSLSSQLSIYKNAVIIHQYSFSQTAFTKIYFQTGRVNALTIDGSVFFSIPLLVFIENFPLLIINDFFFEGCSKLNQMNSPGILSSPSELALSKEVISIGQFAFQGTAFTKITFQTSRTFQLQFSPNALRNIVGLRTIVDFPASEISAYLCYGLKNLSSMSCSGTSLTIDELSISKDTPSVREYAFSGTSFTHLSFRGGRLFQIFLSSNVFSDVPLLTTVVDYPVLEIPSYLFYRSEKLKQFSSQGTTLSAGEATISKTILFIYEYPFTQTAIESIRFETVCI